MTTTTGTHTAARVRESYPGPPPHTATYVFSRLSDALGHVLNEADRHATPADDITPALTEWLDSSDGAPLTLRLPAVTLELTLEPLPAPAPAVAHGFVPVVVGGDVLAGCSCGWDELRAEPHNRD